MQKRGSYSIRCAMRFKHIYDTAFLKFEELGTNCPNFIVEFTKTHYAPTTLHQRMNDGLRFIIDKYAEIPKELLKLKDGRILSQLNYATLRGLVKFRPNDTGVVVAFNHSIGTTELPTNKPDVNWKTLITKFLECDSECFYHVENLKLSDSDIKWVIEQCNNVNLPHKVTRDSITISK